MSLFDLKKKFSTQCLYRQFEKNHATARMIASSPVAAAPPKMKPASNTVIAEFGEPPSHRNRPEKIKQVALAAIQTALKKIPSVVTTVHRTLSTHGGHSRRASTVEIYTGHYCPDIRVDATILLHRAVISDAKFMLSLGSRQFFVLRQFRRASWREPTNWPNEPIYAVG